MKPRALASFRLAPVGLGCMSLSHAYGTPPDRKAAGALLNRALDLGHNHLDTAALYGFGANEELLGEALKSRRNEFVLASKCGLFRNEQGQREIDGRPDTLKKTCEGSLRRLKTDVIDLYYLHRWDRKVPLEDSVGALADLVAEGKVRSIGLSEVSAETLRKAHAVHPISALQNEYSLWTRNAEIAALDACRELGTAFVAFSPLGRGFLTEAPPDPQRLPEKDIRRAMPRFSEPHYRSNLQLAERFAAFAREVGYSRSQLALAWLLSRGEHVLAIPGTTSVDHLEENRAAGDIKLDRDTLDQLDQLINRHTVSGPRYGPATLKEIDAEEFDS